VNFALKTTVVTNFLHSNGFIPNSRASEQQLSPAAVGEMARQFTVQIKCTNNTPEANTAPLRHGAANRHLQDETKLSIDRLIVYHCAPSDGLSGRDFLPAPTHANRTAQPPGIMNSPMTRRFLNLVKTRT
jgi:hypothetical protein